jgi:hypothetical protein
MAPRLKVFVTSDGLTDYVVAASSRAKALAAWGTHQDLFKTGLAHETDDAGLVKAAQAQPETVLRRPAGSRQVLAALKPARKTAAKPAGPTKAQLDKVARLEARRDALERDHRAALDRLDAQRAALEDKHAEARREAEAALAVARAVVRDAG